MIGKRLSAAKSTKAEAPAVTAGPKHVAIIMDGNGRWAQRKGKIRTFGHKAGVESVRSVVRFARQNGIESLTLFAFSSENWKRPEEEVSVLMELFNLVLNSEAKRLHKNGVRLQVIGDVEAFDAKL
ncbi:MAG: polyprenyl diphosphate synthase, partial [Enterobacterales bacterium]|nr:polyprenyl diphosphate synthase [Enterobacterales bacterium]